MQGEAVSAADVRVSEDARLESLGYKPQLNRVLGFFSNFAVGFTYLSPMVGIYSLFVFGLGIAFAVATVIELVRRWREKKNVPEQAAAPDPDS